MKHAQEIIDWIEANGCKSLDEALKKHNIHSSLFYKKRKANRDKSIDQIVESIKANKKKYKIQLLTTSKECLGFNSVREIAKYHKISVVTWYRVRRDHKIKYGHTLSDQELFDHFSNKKEITTDDVKHKFVKTPFERLFFDMGPIINRKTDY
jgi:hypothetical protein